MPPTPLAVAACRSPLVGRPRPACPALPLRLQMITAVVDTARQKADQGMADAAHVLNEATLIAGDSGMTDLARYLCWQHIDTYRRVGRPLTIVETRYLLKPVVTLARLQFNTDQGTTAVRLLESMYQAITSRADLIVDDQTLALAHLVGDQQERRQLRQWVWLQLVGDGVRAFGAAGRWLDAAEHALHYQGVGDHLLEGRQAVIIAQCVHGAYAQAWELLAQSTPIQPWEQDVAACLQIMCTEPTDPRRTHDLTAAVTRFTARTPAPGYAVFHTNLGLTIAALSADVRPAAATGLLGRIADDAIASADGYAARDVLGFPKPIDGITHDQRRDLRRLATGSGLGIGTLPEPIVHRLTATADEAVAVLEFALAAQNAADARPPDTR